MTIKEIVASDKTMLSATDVSTVLGMHPSRVTYYGMTNQLPFNCIISGNRVKIPRMDFIRWMGYAAEGGVNNGPQQ